MTGRLLLALMLSTLFLGAVALADDQSSTQKSGDASDVDNLITNANLRAYSGSKSKWSISNIINYDGGTFSNPFGQGRPNIAGASATSVDTDINDQINIKYAIDDVNSFMFGGGVRKMAPFTGHGPSAAFYASGGKDVDIYDPTLTFQHIYKYLGIQAVAQISVTQYTREDIHSSDVAHGGGNLDKNIGFDQENIYEIGNLSVGGSFGFAGNSATDSSQDYSHYQIWLDPYIEYKLNDNWNLRTVANTWTYEYWQVEHWQHDDWTESVGVGYSAARDVFLYPNIQFLPEHMASNLTNVGLAATINLF